MTITMEQFWMGREDAAVTDEMREDAQTTVDRANDLLQRSGIEPTDAGNGFGCVESGYRPAAINAATPNAAKNSQHMRCRAIDISDHDGELDEWLISDVGQRVMQQIGLWSEHPSATKGWAHVQTVPPKSGRRTFYP